MKRDALEILVENVIQDCEGVEGCEVEAGFHIFGLVEIGCNSIFTENFPLVKYFFKLFFAY